MTLFYFRKSLKNRLILKMLAIPNRHDFTIFKTLRFFEFWQILIREEGSDLQIFASTKILSMLQKKI